jgi:hypothetical protein
MITFQEALDSMEEGDTPSILLANGFSQAWNVKIFNYASLFEAANFGNRDETLRALFNKIGTYDFEKVMKYLVAAETVLTVYNADRDLIASIKEDQEELKSALIRVISETHPDRPNEVSEKQYLSARRFLSKFKEVFTLNYDLLFYWARNMRKLAPENYRTDDGFRQHETWVGRGTSQNVHFLHGGLHIYDSELNIKKHTFAEDGISIIDKVRENLEAGRFPTFVSEPTHEKKKSRIEHNPYLNFCYQKLSELSGTAFIYGHSMDENDKHIFDQIKKSSVRKIFISIYGDPHNESNSTTRGNAVRFLDGPNVVVEFFQAESTPIWV